MRRSYRRGDIRRPVPEPRRAGGAPLRVRHARRLDRGACTGRLRLGHFLADGIPRPASDSRGRGFRRVGLRAFRPARVLRDRSCRAGRLFPLGADRQRRLPALHAARAHPGARLAVRRRIQRVPRGRADGGPALARRDHPPGCGVRHDRLGMSAAFGLMLAVFVGISLLRGPIGLAMIAGGIAYLGATGQDMGLAAEQILNSLYGSFVLIAVPMFIFAANVMNSGSLSERIYGLAHALMGRFRGGLAHVNVLASVIFSGMSGSAIADAVGPGMVEIEMMCKENRYSRPFAVAVSAASATIGPIIPPSIPMVLYALVSGASVGALFLGGGVPGLLMAAAMMLVIIWIARRRNFPMEAPVPWREIPRIFLRTLLPLLMPVLLLGGIYSGVFTPTEAAAVAALYALVLALFVYRALDWKGLVSVLAESARSTAVVGIIICGAFIFNYVLATEQMPARVAEWFTSLELGPLGFLLVANLVFLVLGCLLDTTTLLLVLVPLLVPVAKAVGVDLVHFGVVIVVNMMIGLLTPPYGVLVFVMSGLAGTPVKEIVRELVPFILALVAVLFLITFVPSLVLALPRR